VTNRLLLAAATLAAAAATPALAQDAAGATPPDAGGQFDTSRDTITVAAAGVYLPDYEGSDHNHFTPAPGAIGSVKGFNFTLIGNRLSVDLIPNRPGQKIDVQFGPTAVLNFNRNSLSSIDNRQIRALGKIDKAVELGGYVGIGKTGIITSPYDRLSVSLSYRHDVSGVHDSAIVTPTVNYLTPLSRKSAVGIFASANHAGTGYARTYFSITNAQSLQSGLPTYAAHSGWKDYTLGALATTSLTGDLLHGFKLIAGGTYTRLLNGFSYSPVTRVAGSPNQWLGAVGLAYTF
jgi:outer membrane scaffolding protein for murein synthesis (MipA/OmpV family)